MKRKPSFFRFKLGAVSVAFLLSLFAAASCLGSEPNVIVSWNFDTEEDIEEWRAMNLTKPVLHDGALRTKATSGDPILLSPQFSLRPQAGQYVEIRMRSKSDGIGELFYASSNEGKYGGFSQDKSVSWRIRHDGKFHTYQIFPAWLSEPQIIKIRVDVGSPQGEKLENAYVEIDYIRIVEIDTTASAPMARFDWDHDALKKLRSDADETRNAWISEVGKLDPETCGSNLYLEWEKISNVKNDEPFTRAAMRCLTGEGSGVFSLEIPLFNVCSTSAGSGAVLSKNVDLSAFKEWGKSIYRWDLQLPPDIMLRRIAFTKTPIGTGSLETKEGRQSSLARLQDGVASTQYETILRNCGGKDIANFSFKFNPVDGDTSLVGASVQKMSVDPLLGLNPTGDRNTALQLNGTPAGDLLELSSKSNAVAFPANFSLKPGEALKIVSKYELKTAGLFKEKLSLSFSSENVSRKTELLVALQALPSANLPQNISYVPEPQDLESDYEIGAFYFPGWSKSVNWKKIDDADPIRKPLLGYYDESNPEVVDWQIKWAAENGIHFFLVDWYWRHGQIRLDHWIKAFQKAKYRSHLKWAMMWANHTGYGTHSTDDWKKVTQYWIDNYFKTPEYYTIDGKPVVAIWQQEILDHDMIEEARKEGIELKQGEGCKRAFDITREMCREAGLPGVYFIAMKWPESSTDPSVIQKLANGSFDETTIYHFMDPGKTVANPKLYSFDQVVAASKPNWEARYKTGILPFMPNISTGWDSRPWHGFRNTVVYGRSVSSFKRLLEDYKSFADETGIKRAVLGPLNEWGEGSYIEPNNEFGFGMYEAIRETLCKKPEDGFPVNYAPQEVGLGPYDYQD